MICLERTLATLLLIGLVSLNSVVDVSLAGRKMGPRHARDRFVGKSQCNTCAPGRAQCVNQCHSVPSTIVNNINVDRENMEGHYDSNLEAKARRARYGNGHEHENSRYGYNYGHADHEDYHNHNPFDQAYRHNGYLHRYGQAVARQFDARIRPKVYRLVSSGRNKLDRLKGGAQINGNIGGSIGFKRHALTKDHRGDGGHEGRGAYGDQYGYHGQIARDQYGYHGQIARDHYGGGINYQKEYSIPRRGDIFDRHHGQPQSVRGEFEFEKSHSNHHGMGAYY